MEPGLLNKTSDNNKHFLITTTGGRKLSGIAFFGEGEYELHYFKINQYEKIPKKSVKNAEKIYDYYLSPSLAATQGFCTADGDAYTEAVQHGESPSCNVDDAKLFKTAAGCVIKPVSTRYSFHKHFLLDTDKYPLVNDYSPNPDA